MTDTDTDTIPVLVNASTLKVPRGTDVRGAVSAYDPALAERVASGAASGVDARGLPLALDVKVAAGAILRVVVSARRADHGGDETGA
jgi:hypothetical protein